MTNGQERMTCLREFLLGLLAGRHTAEENYVKYLAVKNPSRRGFPMDIASVFEWFAQESVFAAELAHEPRQREIWTRLAVMWASAAAQCHHEDAGTIGALPTSAATRLEPPQGRAFCSTRSFSSTTRLFCCPEDFQQRIESVCAHATNWW